MPTKLTADGRQRLVRHGHLPEREIMTGIGRSPSLPACTRPRRRWFGAHPLFFGDSAALCAAVEEPRSADSDPLSQGRLHRRLRGGTARSAWQGCRRSVRIDDRGLKDAWSEEHARWSKRDLSAKRYVYFWADGIHVQARLEDDAQCLLVIIGATPEGKKELVGLIDGVRESAQSWRIAPRSQAARACGGA